MKRTLEEMEGVEQRGLERGNTTGEQQRTPVKARGSGAYPRAQHQLIRQLKLWDSSGYGYPASWDTCA